MSDNPWGDGIRCWFPTCPFTYRKTERDRFEAHMASAHGVQQGADRTALPRGSRRRSREHPYQVNFLTLAPVETDE